ncbi:MAG: tetratricopeptide repeat protein, partial [Saprospiraceae bacterium]|nr:tetratricopeptide repeat protein [Saprospiraceae bacterium]
MRNCASKSIVRSGYEIILLLISLIISTSALVAQPPDSLWKEAQSAAENRNFDKAYLLYEQAGDSYLTTGFYKNYLRCRVEMARSSQFTSIVSREAIKEIIDPAIMLIEETQQLKNSREAAECYQFLARYHWAIKGDYDLAIEDYQIALNICDILGDTANQEKMAAMADLSHVYSNREEFDQALDYAASALMLSKKIYGEEHVENGPRYYNLGFTYYRKGHYDRAITEITKGINLLQKNQGSEMQIGLGYNNLSAVYVAQLDQEGALQSSNAAEAIFSKFLGPGHEAIGIIEWDLGVMYLDLKNHEFALDHLLKARDIFQQNFGPSFPQLPQLFHQIGQCYDQLNQYAEAERWHKKAFQINSSQYGTAHVRTGESLRNLAQHYIISNQLEKADDAIAAGLKIVRDPKNQSDLLNAWLYEQKGALLY